MADPYLGNGVQLTTDGALTIKGARTGTWPSTINIADRNGLRVDAATGNAWVHPAYKSEVSVLGLGSTSGFTASTSTRVPGGGFAFYVGQSKVGSDNVTAGTTRPTNLSTILTATTSTSVTLTNTQSTSAAATVTQTGSLGAVLSAEAVNGLIGVFTGTCAIGTRAIATVAGSTYTTYNEYLALVFDDKPNGGIGTQTRTDVYSVPPGGTITVSFALYYRGELPATNGGAALYYGSNFCFVHFQQDRAFSNGDA